MLRDARKLFAASIVTLALAMPCTVPAQPQERGEMGEHREGKERHPEIREAIHHLEAAKNILEHKAAHDFGGHRLEAIESVNQALHHLHEAMEYDKK